MKALRAFLRAYRRDLVEVAIIGASGAVIGALFMAAWLTQVPR